MNEDNIDLEFYWNEIAQSDIVLRSSRFRHWVSVADVVVRFNLSKRAVDTSSPRRLKINA